MITVAPDKDLTLPNVDCEFTLSADDYDWLMDTAKIISSPHISIESDGEKITMSTFDAEDDSAHVNTIDIKEGAGSKFKVVFSTANFKMIPGTYDVQVSFKGITHFKNTKENIEYWIASEAKHSKV